jgi:hypothetical protein
VGRIFVSDYGEFRVSSRRYSPSNPEERGRHVNSSFFYKTSGKADPKKSEQTVRPKTSNEPVREKLSVVELTKKDGVWQL